MTELEKIWNFCEQKKNACDKNVEVIGMDNMLTPPWQTNMGMSNAYWSVQKYIEVIEEEGKTNADRIRSMTDEELAEWLTNICQFENREDEEPYISIYNIDSEMEEYIHDSFGDILIWLKCESKE